jgi:hypothetical protein
MRSYFDEDSDAGLLIGMCKQGFKDFPSLTIAWGKMGLI